MMNFFPVGLHIRLGRLFQCDGSDQEETLARDGVEPLQRKPPFHSLSPRTLVYNALPSSFYFTI